MFDEDPIHQRLAWLLAHNQPASIVDRVLNQCTLDNGECHKCAELCCPYLDPMHFHHDGCPSCAELGDGNARRDLPDLP